MCINDNAADVEDGHTLHLVERPAGLPPQNAAPEPQRQQGHRRINIGMIDTNGAIAAFGVGIPILAILSCCGTEKAG